MQGEIRRGQARSGEVRRGQGEIRRGQARSGEIRGDAGGD